MQFQVCPLRGEISSPLHPLIRCSESTRLNEHEMPDLDSCGLVESPKRKCGEGRSCGGGGGVVVTSSDGAKYRGWQKLVVPLDEDPVIKGPETF